MEIVEGIVLKTSDYRENSKILQVLTKEHGLIGIYLKGANNYRNKSFALAQPITHALFTIYYKTGLSSCFKGEIINNFNSLKIDIEKNVYLYHLFELLLKNLEQHQEINYLFNLILKLVIRMEEASLKDVKIFTLYFELQLLTYLGVAPVLSNCVECGSTSQITNFDITKGGYICDKCNCSTLKSYAVETLQTLLYLKKLNIDEDIAISDETLNELRHLMSDYYLYHLGVKTNSAKFFKS